MNLDLIANPLRNLSHTLSYDEKMDAELMSEAAVEDWISKASPRQLARRVGRPINSIHDLTDADFDRINAKSMRGAIGEVGIMRLLYDLGIEYAYNENQVSQGTNWWDLEVLGEKLDVKVLSNSENDRTCVSWNSFDKISTAFMAPAPVAVLACTVTGLTVKPAMLISQQALRHTLRVSKKDSKNDPSDRNKFVGELISGDPINRDFSVVMLTGTWPGKTYINSGIWILDKAFEY